MFSPLLSLSPWLLTLEYMVLTPPMACVTSCLDGKLSLADEVSAGSQTSTPHAAWKTVGRAKASV